MRDEKGITLAALVITIILLLIISTIAVYSGNGIIKYTTFNKAKSEVQFMQTSVNSWYEEYKAGDETEQNKILNYGETISDYKSELGSNEAEEFQRDLDKTVNDTGISLSGYRFFSEQYLKDNLGMESSFNFLVNVDERSVVLFRGITYEDKTYYTPEDFGITNVANTTTADATSFALAQPDMENNIVIYDIAFADNNGNPMDISKYRIEYQKAGEGSWHNITNKVTNTTYNGKDGFKFPLTESGTYNVKVSTIDKEVKETVSIPFYKYIDIAAYQELDERNIIIYGVLFKDNTENTTRIKINGSEVTITKVAEGKEYKAQLEDGREVTYPTYIYTNIKAGTYNLAAIDDSAKTSVECQFVPPRPAGFSVLNRDFATGYVISDNIDSTTGESIGNEYVWIEVPQTTTVYSSTGLNKTDFTDTSSIETDLRNYSSSYVGDGNSKDTWKSKAAQGLEQSEFNTLKSNMLKSIYQNGGFWIGRYEAGKENNSLVCKVNATPYTNITSSNAQAQAVTAITDNNFTSNLLFGVQWNLVLKYLEVKGAANVSQLSSNSTGIGNYKASSFTLNRGSYYYKPVLSSGSWHAYTEASNGYVTVSNNVSNKVASSEVLTTTGASDRNRKMNIYDIAGNVWEWTLENSTQTLLQPCTTRGGAYDDTKARNIIASARADGLTSSTYANTGFRVSIIYLGS